MAWVGCLHMVWRVLGGVPLRHLLVVALGVAAACLATVAFLHQRLLARRGAGTALGKEDVADERVIDNEASDLHFAWVSDCSEYQEWQSLALLLTIYKQHGPSTALTRLISGCSDIEKERRQQTHDLLLRRSPGWRPPELFFTDSYIRDEDLGDTYPPYNRPHSLEQWVSASPLRPSTRVVLLDPDMLMLRPLRLPDEEAGERGEILYHGRTLALREALRLPALGQRYRYIGARWRAAGLKLDEICSDGADEACLHLDEEEVAEFFSVGPPWIVSFGDLRRALPFWKAYVPRIRRQYRQLIAEMYAYVLAFASIGVRHMLLDHFVVSYPNAQEGEHAWPWVDAAAASGDDDPCGGGGGGPGGAEALRRPTFLHYCEVYHSEDWYFRKRGVPHSQVLSCSAPLFAQPPPALLRRRAASAAREPAEASTWARHEVRQAWFLCLLLSTLNEVIASAREALCPDGKYNATKALRVPLPEGDFFKAMQEFYRGNP